MGIVLLPHMLHVWYIYLHLGDFVRANVSKYSSTMVRIWVAEVHPWGPRKFVRLVTVRFCFSPHRTGVWSGFGGPAEPCEGEWLCRFAEGVGTRCRGLSDRILQTSMGVIISFPRKWLQMGIYIIYI